MQKFTEIHPSTNHPVQPVPAHNDNPSIHDLVMLDIAARKQIGIERYNTILQAGNGRDALWDAYEEVLDLACYLRQEIEERREPRTQPTVEQ